MSIIDDVVNKTAEYIKLAPEKKPEPVLIHPLQRVWRIKDVKLPGQYSIHTLTSPGRVAKALMIRLVCPDCKAIMAIRNGVVDQPAIIECVGKLESGEKCMTRFVVDGKSSMGRIIENRKPPEVKPEVAKWSWKYIKRLIIEFVHNFGKNKR